MATLWPVDDVATSQLTLAFYEALGRGLTKDVTLLGAMAATRQSWEHPYFWSGFNLRGDWRELRL